MVGTIGRGVTIALDTPAPPPYWALLERELLRAQADAIVGAEGVQDRPVQQVFQRIVRAVVAGPARHAEQVAALVEVPREERLAGPGLPLQELPFEQRPARRRLRGVRFQYHVAVGPPRSVHVQVSHPGRPGTISRRRRPLASSPRR